MRIRAWGLAVSVSVILGGGLVSLSAPVWASPPTVTTGEAKNVKRATALLEEGTVNPEGLETAYYFEYGPEACDTTTKTCGVSTAAKSPFTQPFVMEPLKLTRLKPGTTYHYWIVASNADGTVQGEEKTFTTSTTEPAEYVFERDLSGLSFVKPFSVAVNQATGDTYVYERGVSPISLGQFNAEGAFQSSTEVAPAGAFFQVAVDNATGPEQGDVYIAGGGKVYKFDRAGAVDPTDEGALVPDTTTPTIGEGVVSEPKGVAVDSSGNVYVASYSEGEGTYSVSEFSAATGTVIKEKMITGTGNPFALAIDQAGNFYVSGTAGTVEYNSTGACTEPSPGECEKLNAESNKGVAVNASGNIFVSDVESKMVREYAAAGHVSIPNPELERPREPRGLATNNTPDSLYIAEFEEEGIGRNAVEILKFFEARPVEVTTESATQINGDVEALNGGVNPGGVEPAEYYFEYGTEPCNVATGTCGTIAVEQSAAPLTGNITIPVSARLENLTPNTTYHFWIVGVNENSGVGHGEEQTFTTGPTSPPPPGFSPPEGTAPESKTPASSPVYPLLTSIKPVPLPPVPVENKLTRAQKLAKALAACNRKPKKQRAGCKRQARKKYGPVTKGVAKKRRK
jgi:hypothetical protein